MDDYRGNKRSSVSFASAQRPAGLSSGNIPPQQSWYTSRSPLYSPLEHAVFQPGSSSNVGAMNAIPSGTSMCEYEACHALFGLDWSANDRVALGSYREDNRNRLEIISSSDGCFSWDPIADAAVTYPVNNIQWLPQHLSPKQLATSSDSLRIWTLNEEDHSLREQLNLSLCKYNKQALQPGALQVNFEAAIGELPPVTSFHWNSIDPNLLISSSIDTTCIVWDLQSSNYVKTQLIAHDSEVFDVKFLTQSTNLFASCGGDGSVRVFDLRCLVHSTIIYEPPIIKGKANNGSTSTTDCGKILDEEHSNALLRLEPSPHDPNLIATLEINSRRILILDMRNPESPIMVLQGHSSSVNQIKWHPSKRNVLLSCGDDCQVMYWDLNNSLTTNITTAAVNNSNNELQSEDPLSNNFGSKTDIKTLTTPNMFYSNKTQEINNLVWKPNGNTHTNNDWLGCVAGKSFQSIKL